jgi:hypothetical protein
MGLVKITKASFILLSLLIIIVALIFVIKEINMKIKARFNTFSKGIKFVKIPLQIAVEDSTELLKYIGNFADKPLIIDINIDGEQIKKESKMITSSMRDKIFVLCKHYSEFNGYDLPYARAELTRLFCDENQITTFSLSNVDIETASKFIGWLIEKSIEIGFIKDSPIGYSPTIKIAQEISINKKVCIICGAQKADIHHVDAIGMGRNRNRYDDTKHKKIGLCRKHHIEIEQTGKESFCKKYHLEELLN